jgi:hypothetical protein
VQFATSSPNVQEELAFSCFTLEIANKLIAYFKEKRESERKKWESNERHYI